IKSGPNWGNSSQKKKLNDYFEKAMRTLKQSKHTANVQPVLGICYGKSRTSFIKSYMQVMGQAFWHLISDNENLYKDIIKPVGHRAKSHNDKFNKRKAIIANRLTKELLDEFCDDGNIDWQRIV
ncbi:cytosolic protein, partial [bacterium]|nr:cytosolic protein [bacterium]